MTRWHVRKGDSLHTPWEVRTPDGRVLINCSHHGRALERANQLARRIRPGSNIEVRQTWDVLLIINHNDYRETYDAVPITQHDLPALITALTKAKEQA